MTERHVAALDRLDALGPNPRTIGDLAAIRDAATVAGSIGAADAPADPRTLDALELAAAAAGAIWSVSRG